MYFKELINLWHSHNLFKNAQQRLRISALIDMIPFGLVMTDQKDKTILTNRKLGQLLEYDSDLSLVDQLEKLVHLKQLARNCRLDSRACQPLEVKTDKRWLRFVITPVLASRKVIGTIILIEDNTQHKEWERTREEFFAMASHELRTPLTAIRGNLSLMKDYYQPVLKQSPDFQQMVDDMYVSCLRLLNIVNDFLDASKLEQSRLKFDYRPVCLNDLSRNVMADFSALVQEKGVDLKLDDAQDKPIKALADSNRLHQVLTNVIGNALKHTDQGTVTVRLYETSGRVRIDVIDTGAGIPLDQHHLLFRKFQQAKERVLTRDRTQGSGMGLYISKLLIEAMGGQIWLEKSAPGQGSTFSLSLPVLK